MSESMEDISMEIIDQNNKHQANSVNQPYRSVTNSSFISSRGPCNVNNQKQKKSPILQEKLNLSDLECTPPNKESPLTEKTNRIYKLYQKLYESVQNKQKVENEIYSQENSSPFAIQVSPKDQKDDNKGLSQTGTFTMQKYTQDDQDINESGQVTQIMELMNQLDQTLGNPIYQDQSYCTSYHVSNSPSLDQKEEISSQQKQLFNHIKGNLQHLDNYRQIIIKKEKKIAKQEREIQRRTCQLLRKEVKSQQKKQQSEESTLTEPLIQLFKRLEKAKEIFNKNLKEFNKDVQKLQQKEQKLINLQKELKVKQKKMKQLCKQCNQQCHLVCNTQKYIQFPNQQNVYNHQLKDQSFQQKDFDELNFLLDQSSFLGTNNVPDQTQELSIFKQAESQIQSNQYNFEKAVKQIKQSQNMHQLEVIKQELIQQSKLLQQKEEIAKQSLIQAQSLNEQNNKITNSRRLQKCKSENHLQNKQTFLVQRESQIQRKKIQLEEKSVHLLKQEAVLTIKQEQIQKKEKFNEQNIQLYPYQTSISPHNPQSEMNSGRASVQTVNDEYHQLSQLQEQIEIIAQKQKQKEEMLKEKSQILERAKSDLENAYSQLRKKADSMENWRHCFQKQVHSFNQEENSLSVHNQIFNLSTLIDYVDDTENVNRTNEPQLYASQINDIVIQQKRSIIQSKAAKRFLQGIINRTLLKMRVSRVFDEAMTQVEYCNQKMNSKISNLQEQLEKLNQCFLNLKQSSPNKKRIPNTITKKHVLHKLKDYKQIIQTSTNNLMQTLNTTKQINQVSSNHLRRSSSQQNRRKIENQNTKSQEFLTLGGNIAQNSMYLNNTQNEITLHEKLNNESFNQSLIHENKKNNLKQVERNYLQSQIDVVESPLDSKLEEYIKVEETKERYQQYLPLQTKETQNQLLEMKFLQESLLNLEKQISSQNSVLETREKQVENKETDLKEREEKFDLEKLLLEDQFHKLRQIEVETNIKNQKVLIQEEALQKRIKDMQLKSQLIDKELILIEKQRIQLENQQMEMEEKVQLNSSQIQVKTDESILKEKNLEILEQQLIQQEKSLNKRHIQLSNKESQFEQKEAWIKQQIQEIEKRKQSLLHQENIIEQRNKGLYKEKLIKKNRSNNSRDIPLQIPPSISSPKLALIQTENEESSQISQTPTSSHPQISFEESYFTQANTTFNTDMEFSMRNLNLNQNFMNETFDLPKHQINSEFQDQI